jgi:hypothetical protein
VTLKRDVVANPPMDFWEFAEVNFQSRPEKIKYHAWRRCHWVYLFVQWVHTVGRLPAMFPKELGEINVEAMTFWQFIKLPRVMMLKSDYWERCGCLRVHFLEFLWGARLHCDTTKAKANLQIGWPGTVNDLQRVKDTVAAHGIEQWMYCSPALSLIQEGWDVYTGLDPADFLKWIWHMWHRQRFLFTKDPLPVPNPALKEPLGKGFGLAAQSSAKGESSKVAVPENRSVLGGVITRQSSGQAKGGSTVDSTTKVDPSSTKDSKQYASEIYLPIRLSVPPDDSPSTDSSNPAKSPLWSKIGINAPDNARKPSSKSSSVARANDTTQGRGKSSRSLTLPAAALTSSESLTPKTKSFSWADEVEEELEEQARQKAGAASKGSAGPSGTQTVQSKDSKSSQASVQKKPYMRALEPLDGSKYFWPPYLCHWVFNYSGLRKHGRCLLEHADDPDRCDLVHHLFEEVSDDMIAAFDPKFVAGVRNDLKTQRHEAERKRLEQPRGLKIGSKTRFSSKPDVKPQGTPSNPPGPPDSKS